MSDEFRDVAESITPVQLEFDADDIEALMDGEEFEIMIRDRDGAADYLQIGLYTKGLIGGGDIRQEFERFAMEDYQE